MCRQKNITEIDLLTCLKPYFDSPSVFVFFEVLQFAVTVPAKFSDCLDLLATERTQFCILHHSIPFHGTQQTHQWSCIPEYMPPIPNSLSRLFHRTGCT